MINKIHNFFSLAFIFIVIASKGFAYLESHEPYFVGELGSSWEFPSDHLPRGAIVGNFYIAFWNILNKKYLNHIEENSQGLRYSCILRDNIPIEPNRHLTVRELTCAKLIRDMIAHPFEPRSLIALQETHRDMIDYLKQNLPENWKIATPPNQPYSQDIFLYDSSIFDLINLEAVQYSPLLPKAIFTIDLKEKATNKTFRFVQSHIPGGPHAAQEYAKFAKEALKQFEPHLTIVLMGDMNQSPELIQQALNHAAETLKVFQPYKYLPINYPSHINTHLEASWIDHFFTYSPDTFIMGSHFAEDINELLVPIVQLLENKAK